MTAPVQLRGVSVLSSGTGTIGFNPHTTFSQPPLVFVTVVRENPEGAKPLVVGVKQVLRDQFQYFTIHCDGSVYTRCESDKLYWLAIEQN